MNAPTRNRFGLPKLGARGTALVEFALVIPLLLLLVMVTIDFGHLVQTRLILTNVTREGGSIGSRQRPLDDNLVDLLLASGRPLDLAGADGHVYVTRIISGLSAKIPQPAIQSQFQRGSLSIASGVDPGLTQLGLTTALYNRLVYKQANNASDIKEVTVVETFYKYRPITPLPNFMPGMLMQDGGGVIIHSRAVF